jgi:hypothetical protein
MSSEDFGFDKFSWQSIDNLAKSIERKYRVASLRELKGFKRVGKNILVREAEQDFWSVNANDDGSFTIERLVDGIEG